MRTGAIAATLTILLVALAAAAPEAVDPEGPVPPTKPASTAGMVLIPAGEFLMGSDEGEEPTNESPAHRVKLGAFWIDRYEVTNGRYAKFVDAGGYGKKEYWSEAGWAWREKTDRKLPEFWGSRKSLLGDDFDSHPVVGVTWFEAEAFARFEGKRLPTEAEWERAARGTDGRIYPWGGNLAKAVTEELRSQRGTAPVGSNPADISPDGLFDMGASVSEWTGSWFEGYPGTKFESRYWGENARKRLRVARGGSWYEIARGEKAAAEKCRTTFRVYRYNPDSSRDFIGLRLALDGPKPEEK